MAFQCCLFVFYQIKGKAFLGVLGKFRNDISKNLFLFSIKYYIIDVLCSCMVLSLIYDDEEKYVQLFAIFNFSVQLISLYLQENMFLHYFCNFANFLKGNKRKKINEKI